MRAHALLLLLMGCSSPPPPPAGWSQKPDVVLDDERLILWLDANEPSTVVRDPAGHVAAWLDRSNAGNDAHVVYATGVESDAGSADPPPITLDDIGGGRVAMTFGPWISPPPSLGQRVAMGGAFVVDMPSGVMDQDWLFIVIGKEHDTADGLFIRGNDSSLGGGAPYGPCLLAREYATGSDRFGLQNAERMWNDDALHAFAFGIDGTHQTAWLRVDGTKTSILSGLPGKEILERFAIGGDPQRVCAAAAEGCYRYASSLVTPLEGAIAEIMVFRGTSGTDGELAFLSSYFQGKYGVKIL